MCSQTFPWPSNVQKLYEVEGNKSLATQGYIRTFRQYNTLKGHEFIITPFLVILSPFPQECSACSNVLNCIIVLHGGWHCRESYVGCRACAGTRWYHFVVFTNWTIVCSLPWCWFWMLCGVTLRTISFIFSSPSLMKPCCTLGLSPLSQGEACGCDVCTLPFTDMHGIFHCIKSHQHLLCHSLLCQSCPQCRGMLPCQCTCGMSVCMPLLHQSGFFTMHIQGWHCLLPPLPNTPVVVYTLPTYLHVYALCTKHTS